MIARLLNDHRLSVPMPRTVLAHGRSWPAGHRCVRISAQLYNSQAQYDYLAECLQAELDHELALTR